ncbi:MAG TPA: PIN domain-containing protein [Thermoleophilia bacterium]|nr:PIN domain-containing protein [Thermoleophilia bacterium]
MVVSVRLLLALVGGVICYELGRAFLPRAELGQPTEGLLVALSVLVGIVLGVVLGGFLGRSVTRLGRRLDRASSLVTASGLLFTTIGLLVGLGVAALGGLAIKNLPVVGPYLLPLLYAVSGYLFAYLGYKRHTDMARVLGFKGLLQQPGVKQFIKPKLLDTSVIIDGRIGDVVSTGFLEGDLVIPGFVLEELQSIADSAESGKRSRGRRGLDTVRDLQEVPNRVIIIERDFPNVTEVDAKLLKLAKEMKACILTTDYNLNKLAQIQGVEVLNVNELSNSLKAMVLPGESLGVRILREGKEEDQGVAYLDDGTMVVIEGGRNRVGEEVEVEVTSILQNPSGRMIFSRLAS